MTGGNASARRDKALPHRDSLSVWPEPVIELGQRPACYTTAWGTISAPVQGSHDP
jgi:hypothetical protein